MGNVEKLRSELGALVGSVVLISPQQAKIVIGGSAGESILVAGRGGPYAGLAAALYRFYCGWSPPPTMEKPNGRSTFLTRLRAANPLQPQYVAESAAHMGDSRERLTSPTGHYLVLGGPIHAHRTGRQVRFYWNIPAPAAAEFLTAICKPLVDRRIPFEAKVPAWEEGYNRTDAAVLYINIEHIEVARDIIEAGQEELRPWLGDETPFFTERLDRGLAFAETPPENGSFGLHRCTLTAEGMSEACQQGLRSSRDTVAFLCRHLRRYGLDLSQPARNPGTAYPYRLPGSVHA